jgi:hypothetical protein
VVTRRLALLTAVALLAPSAHAEEGAPRAAVVVLAAADPPVAPAVAAASLARRLASRRIAVVADPFGAARAGHARALEAEARVALAAAARLAGDGWRAYLDVRPDEAAERLRAARDAAVVVGAAEGARALIADISLRLGAVELALGRPADAERELRLAIALDPGRAVSDAEFKPAVVAAHGAARIGAAPASEHTSLAILPADAALEIDGAPASGTSAALANGLHLVVARAAGHRAGAALIEVRDHGDAPALTLAPDPVAAALDGGVEVGGGTRAAAALDALLAAGALDEVWLLAPVWRQGGAAVLGQRCRGASACSPVSELRFDDPRGVDAAVAVLVGALRPGRARLALPDDARLVSAESRPRPVAAAPLWRNPWLWIGVGGIAVASIATAVILSSDSSAEPTVSLDPGEWGHAPGL